MTTYTSKRVGELAITPRNDKAVKTIAFFTEQGFSDKALVDVAKAQTDDFSVTEVDYCAMLADVRNDDMRASFERIRAGMGAGLTTDWQSVLDEAAEVISALEVATSAERKQYGVSSRYQFSATTGKWARRESTPRTPKAEGAATVGEPVKVLTHCFVGNDGFSVSDTNAQKLYKTVKAHYEPTWKATSQTDVKHTAIPYFGKHGKYSNELK